jgi:predicted ATPase
VTLDTAEKFGSLDDPADQIKAQTLEALITQLLTLAQSSPVLFLIEDGHWIDPTTLALIEAAIQRIHDSRVLLPITHRPDWQPVYSGVTTCSSIVWAKQKALN